MGLSWTPEIPALSAHPAANRHAPLLIVAFGAACSMLLSGYAGGQENNYYHLPILAGLYDEPQFANDLFVQSLRYYASGFWQLFSGHVHGQAVFPLLFALQVCSRLLLFAGMLAWGSLLGVRGNGERLLFVTLLALSSLLRGYSKAGAGGLLIDSFTQSELANGTTLLALAWAARGRVAAAFAMNGVTFFINAFIAVWAAVPMAFILAALWRDERWTVRALMRQAVPGLALFAVLAAPVVRNILANPYGHAMPAFDYVTFLEEFFPYHFLVWTVPWREVALLAAIFCGGIIAAGLLRPAATGLAPALWGAGALWVAGMVLPYLTHARMLLNLHLLRAGTLVHLLAAAAVAALVTRWATSRRGTDRLLWAPLLAFVACMWDTLAIALPLVLLARRQWPLSAARWQAWAAPAFVAAIALGGGVRAWHAMAASRHAVADRADWQALGMWAQARTAPDAVFLLPAGPSRGSIAPPRADAGQAGLFDGALVFPYFAHRQVWVLRHSGSAVMWAPAYYPTWHGRMGQVTQLRTLPGRLDYAAAHGIAYVIDGCDGAAAAPAARFGRLCAFAVPARSERSPS